MDEHKMPVGYSPRLYNEDLAPVPEEKRTWKTYNLFALWMTDVHNVGTYVFAAALFATGLTGWQVFLGMLVGIMLVYFFINLVGKPSQPLVHVLSLRGSLRAATSEHDFGRLASDWLCFGKCACPPGKASSWRASRNVPR